jgi:hypothetical protein
MEFLGSITVKYIRYRETDVADTKGRSKTSGVDIGNI